MVQMMAEMKVVLKADLKAHPMVGMKVAVLVDRMDVLLVEMMAAMMVV